MIVDKLPYAPQLAAPNWFMRSFTAPYDGATGSYDFSLLPSQVIFQATQGGLYLFDQYQFGGSIPETAYIEGTQLVDSLGGISARITLEGVQGGQGSGQPNNFPVLPFANYSDTRFMRVYVTNKQQKSEMKIKLTGKLAQTSQLVSFQSVTLNIGFSIFEIIDNRFINNFNLTGYGVDAN